MTKVTIISGTGKFGAKILICCHVDSSNSLSTSCRFHRSLHKQIMFLCRLLADFTRAESDMLRKALGRKKTDELSELKAKFIKGGLRNGHKKAALEMVWEDWVRKGMYLINKAHAVCYSLLGYQMAYLKANYPDEFEEVMNTLS